MSEPRARCRLEGKAPLVTGASRGIGAACARELTQAGARVLAADASRYVTGAEITVDEGFTAA